VKRWVSLGLLWFTPVVLAAEPARIDRTLTELDSPAGPGSAQPNLASRNGTVYLTWIEPAGGGQKALRISRWSEGWSPPRTIVSSGSLLANWADFPSLLPLEDGSLVAHWLQKIGRGAHEYDVLVARSTDGGESWSMVGRPHRDQTLNQHGFVSLVDQGGGRFAAVWLDGRGSAHELVGDPFPQDEILLMFAEFENGAFQPEVILDPLVCDCCQTAAARVGSELFVAYRDRSAGEVRDIAYVRSANGRWTEPGVLYPDGWRLPACPVNGPAISVAGQRLAVAWFSGGSKRSVVQVVFSASGGRTFGAPVRVDEGKPVGRVDVEWMEDGSVLVLWLELTRGKKAETRARRARSDGAMEPSFVVAPSSGTRSSGFPRMAQTRNGAFFAWTDPGPPSRVRLARLAHPED